MSYRNKKYTKLEMLAFSLMLIVLIPFCISLGAIMVIVIPSIVIEIITGIDVIEIINVYTSGLIAKGL